MGKFVIIKNKSGYSYHFEGEDALILGTGDSHKNLASARVGIDSIKNIAADCRIEDRTAEKVNRVHNPKYEIYKDGNKKLRFVMKAKNGQRVLQSVPFKEMDDLLAAIETIKNTASDSAIQS